MLVWGSSSKTSLKIWVKISHPRGESTARGEREGLETSQKTPKHSNSDRKIREMKTDEEIEKYQRRCFKDRVADRVFHEGREVSTGFGNEKVMGDPDKRNFTGNVGQKPVCGRGE